MKIAFLLTIHCSFVLSCSDFCIIPMFLRINKVWILDRLAHIRWMKISSLRSWLNYFIIFVYWNRNICKICTLIILNEHGLLCVLFLLSANFFSCIQHATTSRYAHSTWLFPSEIWKTSQPFTSILVFFMFLNVVTESWSSQKRKKNKAQLKMWNKWISMFTILSNDTTIHREY